MDRRETRHRRAAAFHRVPPGLEDARQAADTAGDVHDRKGGSTWCPGCGTCLIERDWYQLGSWQLTESGACRKCGTQIPGVFAGAPGGWGARRLAVRLAPRTTAGR